MKILLEDLKTEIKKEDCDFTKGQIIAKEIQTFNGSEFQYIYKLYSKKEILEIEIGELKSWFDKYYSQHEQKYRRLDFLGLKCDDGTNPKDRLTELYKEAETNRKRIQELEQELGENNGSNDN